MSGHITRYSRTLAGWAVVLALGACGGEARNDAGDPADLPPAGDAETGALGDTAPAPSGAAAFTDANIVALLDEANKADSSAGALAAEKATNPEVKAYAKLMMSEHHALRAQGQDLAKKLKVTPEPPANDPVKAAAGKEMDLLQSTPKGAEFDRAYIDQEVAVHKAVIDLAEKAHGSTQQAELKALIEKAKPILEKHLEQAEALQKKLGSSPA